MSVADLLIAQGVRKEFGGLVAVNDVDFTIPERTIVSLIGPNGAGKTTFFNMLTGVYKPTAGEIVFDGDDVTGKPPHAFTQRGIGRTFQNIRLFQNMTALENVLVGMHSRPEGRHPALGPRHSVPEARGGRRAGAGARAARVTPVSAAARTSTRRTSRTATSAGSRSRARSRRSRSSCCSTSRPPA